MSVYPCVNGIHILNQDILSYIFTLNADMFADTRFANRGALRTTCITSHVCQNWRNLMLATPSLWARLIDMDCFSETWIVEVTEELIRRSGAAPLWIKAQWTWFEEDAAEFLLSVIKENWHRIQKLVISDQEPDFIDDLTQLALKFPAQCLETFNLEVGEYDNSEDLAGIPFKALFGGHAPMLRRFCLDGFFVHRQEPCLRHLHSLVLAGEYQVRDILATLTATHSLQELEIRCYEDELILQSFPIVSLPQLRSLTFSGSPYRCTMILDHVALSSGCSLTISINSLSEEHSLEETDERHILVVDAFNRHVRRLLKLAIFQVVHLSHYHQWTSNYIEMRGEASSPVKCWYSIKIALDEKHVSSSNQFTVIFNRLAQLDLSRTTTLNFSSSATFNNSLFFASLSSINTLCVCESSLEYLIALQEDINSTQKPHILFPFLQTLDFIIVSHHNHFSRPTDPIEVAVKFILPRAQNGYPISVLNTTRHCFGFAPNLDALAEAQDLKVLYKLEGMTGIFEYVCGRGKPARQI